MNLVENGLFINCKLDDEKRWLGFVLDNTFHSVLIYDNRTIHREMYGKILEKKLYPSELYPDHFYPEIDAETGKPVLYSLYMGDSCFELRVGNLGIVVRYD